MGGIAAGARRLLQDRGIDAVHHLQRHQAASGGSQVDSCLPEHISGRQEALVHVDKDGERGHVAGPGCQVRCGVPALTARVQCLWARLHRAQELLRVPLRRAGEHGGVQRVGRGHRGVDGLGGYVMLACGGTGRGSG